MRLFAYLAVSVAVVNAGIQIPTTLQSLFTLKDRIWAGFPNIPQVILDTNHPWLAANKR